VALGDVIPEVKLQQLIDLARKSSGNVISLDDSTYNYYAINKPRPYSLIVLFTALNPKFKCTLCKNLDREYTLTAESYRDDIKARRVQPDVFFLRLDYEQAPRTFQSYETTSVPLIFHVPQYQGDRANAKEFSILIKDRMQMPMSSEPEAEAIAKFVQQKTGAQFEIRRSMLFAYLLLAGLFGIVLLLVDPVIRNLPLLLKLVQFKPLWMLVSAVVYTCAISGFIFDIIRSPPMFHSNPQTGQRMYFYPQSGNQFVVEGFIIGFLNIGCAAALICASLAATKPYRASGAVPIIVCLVVFTACFTQIRSFYIMKNRWYGSAQA
jgi:oligosaccharyltransferase complex subunit gamma